MLDHLDGHNYRGYNPKFYRRVMAKRAEEQRRRQAEHNRDERSRLAQERADASRRAQEEAERRAQEKIDGLLSHYQDRGLVLNRTPIRQIIIETALKHSVTEAEIVGKSRAKKLVAARHEAIWRVRTERPDLSLPVIGRAFGNLDHTTVLFAFRKIEAQRAASA